TCEYALTSQHLDVHSFPTRRSSDLSRWEFAARQSGRKHRRTTASSALRWRHKSIGLLSPARANREADRCRSTAWCLLRFEPVEGHRAPAHHAAGSPTSTALETRTRL